MTENQLQRKRIVDLERLLWRIGNVAKHSMQHREANFDSPEFRVSHILELVQQAKIPDRVKKRRASL